MSLKHLLAVFFILTAPGAAAPPNIVWIIADDMSPDTGAYGLAQVKTPHLDRLAAEG